MWLALHSAGVLAPLLCSVLPESLVWIQVSIGVSIRVANSNIKQADICLSQNLLATIYAAAHPGRCELLYSTLILSCDVLQNWFHVHVFTQHAKQFSLQIPQFTIAFDDKPASFAHHSMIHSDSKQTH